jgi:hypothetical protein
VSNGNGAAALVVTVAILTGMAHAHGAPARRHATARHWARPERAELGGAKIPVTSLRTRTADRHVPGKAAPEAMPEVIVGYIDPHHAAFHRLTRVVEGDRVKVIRRDHSVAWFTVDSVRRGARSPVPRRPASGRPELRLISLRVPERRRMVVSAHLDRS